MKTEPKTMKTNNTATRKRQSIKPTEATAFPAQIIRDFAEAVAEAFGRKLLEIGPTLARLAQADTLHSTEQPQTVFRRAIAEGDAVRGLLAEKAARTEG